MRPLFDREGRSPERLRGAILRALPPSVRAQVITVALYGSVARRQERPVSDIDLLVLVPSAAAARPVREAFERVWEPVAAAFGNSLALYVNTIRDAQRKVRRRLPLWLNLLREHQVVWGIPLEEALRGRSA